MQKKTDSKIWLSPPHMSGYEKEFIDEAFKTNWISPKGPNVDNFEHDIADYLQSNRYVTALNSGTSAIHLALQLLDVKRGDEVICQSKTFAASVFPVVYLGAEPIFIDSEELSWNICPTLLETAIKNRISNGKKPKAIIAVHLYGMPYNVQAINQIANHYKIPVIEDSAEAFGSTYNGKKCGTFGEVSILSFNGNKIITTSGGGALITKSEKLKHRAIYLASQAKDKDDEYTHSKLGYNYRMSNVLAGIGRGQMKVLERYVTSRRDNYDYYFKHLSPNKDITFLDEPVNCISNRWLSCILLSSNTMQKDLIALLQSHHIQSKPSWKPMHIQPLFKKYPKFLNGVSESIYKRGLCLPSGSNLTKTDLDRIINIIQSYFK